MIDETYLRHLCDHLAKHPPREGRWTITARRWPRSSPAASSGMLLGAPRHELYLAADAARLPTPDEDDGEHQIVHENALAAVLAGFALITGQGSSCGHRTDAPTIAEVLATEPVASMRHILGLLMRRDPEGYRRLLLLCGRASCSVDLRTLAAVAYATADGPETRLQSNPTGRWLHVPLDDGWEPMLTCARATWAAR
ncbi:hypothetical protein ACH4VR_40365 [Streptomyces sp. NPDC020883]|uniref:hypothetical protein n=1 Tax=Streptomyces sp. NPDC020883 TaxID=3365099 RepID=UPI0037A52348